MINKIFAYLMLSIGQGMALPAMLFCADSQQVQAKRDVLGQWIGYLEKKLVLTQQFYYEIAQNINIYLVMFFLLLIVGMIGIWWYVYLQARKMVKQEIGEAKAALHGLIMQNLKEHEKNREMRLDTMEGKLYESLAIAFNGEGNYGMASVWYARTFHKYNDKGGDFISEEHKARILDWLAKCLEKTKALSSFGVNEINMVVKLIDDKKYIAQKEKIISRLKALV